MIVFEEKRIGRILMPQFFLKCKEAVLLSFGEISKKEKRLLLEILCQISNLHEAKPILKPPAITEIFNPPKIKSYLKKNGIPLLPRIVDFLSENNCSTETNISNCGYNVRLLMRVEHAVLISDYVFVDASGLDFLGSKYLKKIISEELEKEKSFIIYCHNDNPFFSKNDYRTVNLTL